MGWSVAARESARIARALIDASIQKHRYTPNDSCAVNPKVAELPQEVWINPPASSEEAIVTHYLAKESVSFLLTHSEVPPSPGKRYHRSWSWIATETTRAAPMKSDWRRGMLFGVLLVMGCTTVKDQPEPKGSLQESQFGLLRIYTTYTPQVQRRDFNGVFDIGPDGARIVRTFWKERFNELTRESHYGEFFLEFYDYMASFAQSSPEPSRQKEVLLDGLEKSFWSFCAALNIGPEFERFRAEQERILEGGRTP